MPVKNVNVSTYLQKSEAIPVDLNVLKQKRSDTTLLVGTDSEQSPYHIHVEEKRGRKKCKGQSEYSVVNVAQLL